MEYESETTTVDMYGIKSKVKVDTASLCTKAMVLDGSKLQFFGRVFVGQKIGYVLQSISFPPFMFSWFDRPR